MKGVIGITDRDWFEFLGAQLEIDEVNFWRPRDLQRPRFATGTPYIFKLKKAQGGQIVGFGVFVRHSVLPVWMAWQAFGRANGADSLATMRQRIERLRRDPMGAQSGGDYSIGCLMLSTPVFFNRADWIEPPADWSPNIVQEKSYDLDRGEGARVWEQCLVLARRVIRPNRVGEPPSGSSGPRYGEPILVRPRLGQGTFRVAVMDAYGRSCAVTTEHSLPVLEAAHIRPYSDGGPHDVSNGLLLRTDIHRLFDTGYVTVSPEALRFEVSRRLRDDYENGRVYYALHGSPIHQPRQSEERPSREFLEWHARERYRG